MTRHDLKPFLRSNWHLLILLALLLASAPFIALWQRERPAGGAKASSPANSTARGVDLVPQIQPTPPRATEQERVRETLASHEQRFEADPKSAEAPALLNAMGNLYRQKFSDYGQAASCFERLISDYPDWPGMRDAYLQLVICYERMGDIENRTRVLRRMIADFPPDSQEYLYASQQLGR